MRPIRSPAARRVTFYLLAALVGMAGAWAGMRVLPGRTVAMGPFRVGLSAQFGEGETDLAVPPFGRLSADTHRSPLRLTATLAGVNVPKLTEILQHDGADGLVRRVQDDAARSLVPFALWLLLTGLAGATVLALVAFRTNWRAVLVAVLAALLAVGGGEVAARATFRPSAFLSPTFSGTLALAPQFIGKVEEATDRIQDFQEQLRAVVSGAARVYANVASGGISQGAQIRVLHISDIHLSPLGMEFAQEVARGFDVDLVADTGDITSFGTPAENLILKAIPAFGRPYLFVRGNHDSRMLQQEMTGVPNAHVLDGGFIRIAGLTIYGRGDPVFTPDKQSVLDDAEIAAESRAVGGRIRSAVEASARPVDLVMVHDDRMAEAVAGVVPLVISGHFHEQRAREVDGTIFLRDGTTGGAGGKVFTQQGGIPLSAEVLYFTTSTPEPTLEAYDVIEQNPETGSLTVFRHLVSQEFGDLAPGQGAGPSAAAHASAAAHGGTPGTPSVSPTP